MERIEETLMRILEGEGEFMEACIEYLHCGREKEPNAGEYIDGLLAVHRIRFDEIDAQLTALEKIS